MEIRGSIADRPWGVTLGAIALRRHTGQLAIESEGKRYGIAFDDGAIVGAWSPLAADTIVRIALTHHFITSPQVADLTRRLAGSLDRDRDEVEVLSEAIRCSPEQAQKLRHRLIAQRAARTFSIERGDFVLDDRAALPGIPGVTVDHRHAIYLGVRTNLSEQRLIDDLRELGAFFVLKPEAIDELPRFGFEPSAHPVIEALKVGTSLPELEASHRELDPRFAQAVIYALVSCAACVISSRTAATTTSPALAPTPAPPGIGRTATPMQPGVGRTATPSLRAQGTPLLGARTQTPRTPLVTPSAPSAPSTTGQRTTTSLFASRASAPSPTAYAAAAPYDTGTNTPAATRPRLRSEPEPQPPSSGRAQPPAPSTGRILTPAPSTGRILTPAPSTGRVLTPTTPTARVLTPTLSTGRVQPPAPSTGQVQTPAAAPDPGDTVRTAVVLPPAAPSAGRVDTDDGIKFGELPTPTPPPTPEKRAGTSGEPSTGVDPRTASDRANGFGDQRTPSEIPAPSRVPTDNAAAAEAAFKRGELAMKRDQPAAAIVEFKAACELNPTDVDYAGMLAWAKFCAAADKPAVGAETRKLLERAVFKSQRPERARFLLGRVERMLGRDKEALRHFQEVLDLKPNHAEAASEIRAIEARLQAARTGGLFGRKK